MDAMVARPFSKALTTDSAATSFASKIPTTTAPTGNGVLDLVRDGGRTIPCAILLVPYATAGDNDTFDMRVIGWRSLGTRNSPDLALWIPTVLAEFSCTLGAAVGIAGAQVVNTERFADTITVTKQFASTDTDSGGAASQGMAVLINSPVNDLVAQIQMEIFACEKLEFTFDSTAVGTTAMNCLYALLG